jgi:hypothetical protein
MHGWPPEKLAAVRRGDPSTVNERNMHMNARSILTRRRSLQVLTTSLLAPFVAAQRRDGSNAGCHHTTSSRIEEHNDGHD